MIRPGAVARAVLLGVGLACLGTATAHAQDAGQQPLEPIPDEMFELRPSFENEEAGGLSENDGGPGASDDASEELLDQGTLGQGTLGQGTLGQEALGQEALGQEALGQEALGQEALGEEASGQERSDDTVFAALRDGRFLTALSLAGDDPGRRALATLWALRVGIVPDGLSAQQAFARAADDLARAYTLGDVPSSVWAARAASGADLDAEEVQTIAERLARAAAAGRSDAAFLLADVIRSTGRADDQPRAVALLRQAASAGLPDAQYELGVRHRFGDGVRRDEARAAELIGEAARAGLPDAQLEYGLMLFNGIGVEADRRAAADLVRRAAIAGNPVAQNRLARLYARGLGVEVDAYLASFWHLLAREPRGGRDEGISDPVLDGFLAGVPADALTRARVDADAFHPSPTPRDAAALLAVFGWPEPT